MGNWPKVSLTATAAVNRKFVMTADDRRETQSGQWPGKFLLPELT
jgi:hypothetical protein